MVASRTVADVGGIGSTESTESAEGTESRDDAGPVVTLHLWGVAPAVVPLAVARMGLDRPLLRRTPATFTKLLGTGDGRTFTVRDADPLHWGVLAVWRDAGDAVRFEAAPTVRGWDRLARERLRVAMRPVASRGTWARQQPFGDPTATRPPGRRPVAADGPVASITRARLRARRARTFWRAVPPVSADLHRVGGLRMAVGIGEAPVGLQGTFSLWEDAAALRDFAHRRDAHRVAVRRTAEEDWYAEELFARFTVLDVDGTFGGRVP